MSDAASRPPHAGEEPDVLVVGAGPVGLTMAYELARRNVRVRVIDRADGPATTSRATATHARTLEIFDQMGLLDDLLPRGQRVVHFSLHRRGRMLISFDTNYSALPTRFPFSLMVDQVRTEEVLRTGLKRLGVEVEWSVALEDFAPGADAVQARLSRFGAPPVSASVPWLVGADGAHSIIRKGLGLRLLGESTETWMNADVVLDAELPRDSNHLLHLRRGTLLLVPFPDPGKWRVVDTVDTDDAEDWYAVRDRLAGKLSEALGRPVGVGAPSWVSVFTAQQRMVQRMRVGRCFVAGDAAHVHSPASGQGMNTGIQDAYNLGWKLASVVRGEAAESLLDSYSAERVPVGARLLDTTKTATALVALRTALAPVLLPAGLTLLRSLKPVKRRVEAKMIRGFSGLALEYADGPLTLQGAAGVTGAADTAGAAGVTGATGATGVIAPGHRVGCAAAAEREHPGWRALVEELRDPRWTLLVFADGGTQPDIADDAAISVRPVSRRPDFGLGAERGRPLADPDGALAAAFGARPGECALIRPDGYLAGLASCTQVAARLAGLGIAGLTRAAGAVAMDEHKAHR